MRMFFLGLAIVVIGLVATFLVELREVRAWQANTSIERPVAPAPSAPVAVGEIPIAPTPTIPDLVAPTGVE